MCLYVVCMTLFKRRIHTSYMHIHTRKVSHIHANTYSYIHIWIEICACMLYVWPFLNVEYIHHTCTYMTHTGIWNLIYTAYRILCICMYHIVSGLYLFNAFVSACIYSCICMYVMAFACICMYEPANLPGNTLEGALRLSVRLPGCLCCWQGLCSTHFQFTWWKDYNFFKAQPLPTRGSQWARSWPTCWCKIGGCQTPDARRGRRCPLKNRRPHTLISYLDIFGVSVS